MIPVGLPGRAQADGEAAEPIGVVHYGLGPIGLEIVRLVRERHTVRSVAAIDRRPDLLGRRLDELLEHAVDSPRSSSKSVLCHGQPASDVVVDEASVLVQRAEAKVVAHSTGSSLTTVMPQLLTCIEWGLSVVSTCEELAYPWIDAPKLAQALDHSARTAGVAVLGTGVNPGFAMDYLPVVLSGASQSVEHVRVHRVQEAGRRRRPLQEKIGAGLDVAAFEQRVEAGTVRHVGLVESGRALAAAFGWSLSELAEQIEPVLAPSAIRSEYFELSPGQVAGVRQHLVGREDGREVLSLTLEMAIGLDQPRDVVELSGVPEIQLVIPGGIQGDLATAAVAVNALERIVEAPPGLLTMVDLPPVHP